MSLLQTVRFLEDSPCKTQTKVKIFEFLDAIKKYKLSKTETLMIVNDPPTTPLHIQLLVEDSEERLSEEEVAQIIAIVKQWLLPKDTEGEEDE